MPSVRSAMIIFLHTIISCNQPSPCRPEDLTLLLDTLRAIINTVGTPPERGGYVSGLVLPYSGIYTH